MGNSNFKLADKCAILSKDEVPIVAGSFKCVSKNSDKISNDDLIKFWSSQMDPRLAQYITNYLFGPLSSRAATVEFQRFAELFVGCVRGTIEERISILLASLGQIESEVSDIAYPLIKEYVEAVVSSYLRTVRLQAGDDYKSWDNAGYRIEKDCVQKLAESLAYDVVREGTQKVTRDDMERWFQQNPIFLRMLEELFHHLYNYRVPVKGESNDLGQIKPRNNRDEAKLLPFCEGIDTKSHPTITDMSQMLFINSNLPPQLRGKWRFLFSSRVHGESFSTLLGKILDQGPTVFIIEETNGNVFGGFATANLSFNPKFVGDDSAFLYSLKPKMRAFTATGYNDHYQYMNMHQHTMPNGLGMGGQFDYWGLWLDSEYGKGECSESCTTFQNYTQLSFNKTFEFANLEVWGVGEKPKIEDDEERDPKKSILDNIEEKAILELAGRQQYSEGQREVPNI